MSEQALWTILLCWAVGSLGWAVGRYGWPGRRQATPVPEVSAPSADLRDYAVMVLVAGDVDTIFAGFEHTAPAAAGQVSLPAEAVAYVDTDTFEAWGELRADDLIFSAGQNRFYGFLLRAKIAVGPMQAGDLAVAVRGTMDPLEWVNDGLALIPVEFPAPGRGDVGEGFWGVYKTLTMNGRPAAREIARLAAGQRVFVAGHSLGAALATYLAYDLQPLVETHPYIFASPHPGTADFVAHYQEAMPRYVLVNYEIDVVPTVPMGIFTALRAGGPGHNVHTIKRGTPGALPSSLGANHNPANYASMLDPTNPRAQRLARIFLEQRG